MLYYVQHSIFDSAVEALVNPVNCNGICGAGLALQFKRAFPENYSAYYKYCKSVGLKIGQIFVFESPNITSIGRYIFNFPTKTVWNEPSKLDYIEAGMLELCDKVKEYNIKSIAIPALGCGLGGLHWNDVHKVIINACTELDGVDIVIHEPKERKYDKS